MCISYLLLYQYREGQDVQANDRIFIFFFPKNVGNFNTIFSVKFVKALNSPKFKEVKQCLIQQSSQNISLGN